MTVASAKFKRLKIEYAVGTPVPVDPSGITLGDQTLVTINFFYRAKPQSVPIPAKVGIDVGGVASQSTFATGVWKTYKNGFSFTPATPGHYKVTLTGVTLAPAGGIASILTMQVEDVCVVNF
jgi:hypothetical protein